jgi:MFS family permease
MDLNCCRQKRGGLTMREWLSIGILFMVNLLNYMDRFTIAGNCCMSLSGLICAIPGVLTDIQDYFTINDTLAGLLQTVFIIAFMICAPLCGYLGDR